MIAGEFEKKDFDQERIMAASSGVLNSFDANKSR